MSWKTAISVERNPEDLKFIFGGSGIGLLEQGNRLKK